MFFIFFWSKNNLWHFIFFRFVSVEEKKRLGTIKENEVLVQRKKEVLINNQTQTVTVPFRIVDQPLKLQQNEWYVFESPASAKAINIP